MDPAQMPKICDVSRANGHVGGSTLDRLPLEMSVMQTTSAFQTSGLLRAAQSASQLEPDRLVATDLPILIEGEPGSGRTTAARGTRGGILTLDIPPPYPKLSKIAA